jgi:hypothetical protein
VFELEHGDSPDPLDQADAGLVEFLDACDLVDLVFGPPAERLDHAKARTFRGAASRCPTRQLPPDVVDGMPGEVSVDGFAAIGHRFSEVREPVEQHRGRDSAQRLVIDCDAPAVVRGVDELHGGGLNRAKRVENGTAHCSDLQDTFAFLMYRR